MSILITGASGFIGKALVEQQRKIDNKVKIKALFLPSEKSQVEEFKSLKIEPIFGDITDPKSLHEAVKGVRTIFHLAAEVDDNATLKRFYDVNYYGTQSLIDAFLKQGGERFIYVSTAGIYGLNLPNKPISEDYKKQPIKGYRGSKYAGEVELFKASREHNFFAAVLRPPIAFGPGDNHFSPKIFDLILNNKKIPLFSKGKALLPFCYVEDIAQSLISASLESKARGEAFLVTSYQVSQKELFDTVGEVCDCKPNYFNISYSMGYFLGYLDETISRIRKSEPKLTRHRVKQLGRTRIFDTTKIKKILKFKTKYSFKDAWEKTYQWFKENRLDKSLLHTELKK